MTRTITIYTTSGPFGRLSNNFRQEMYIDDKKWLTVTNFIYSQMLTTPINKIVLRNARPISNCTGESGRECEKHKRSRQDCQQAGCRYTQESVYDQYVAVRYDEIEKEELGALHRALRAKFSDVENNQKLVQELLDTDRRRLIYVSNNLFLGTGQSNDGANRYGRALEQIRHELRQNREQGKRAKDTEEYEKRVYRTYIAYKTLQELMLSGKCNDLSIFLGETPLEICRILKAGGRDKCNFAPQRINLSPPQDIVVDAYNAGPNNPKGKWLPSDIHTAMLDPKSTAALVRSVTLGRLRRNGLIQKRETVIVAFMSYGLEQTYPDLQEDQYSEAMEQQLMKKPPSYRVEIGKEILECHEKGDLPEGLLQSIGDALKKAEIDIPDEGAVQEAELEGKSIREKAKKGTHRAFDSDIGAPEITGDPQAQVLISPGTPASIFSPLDESQGMIEIDKRLYPSVSYYLIATRFTEMPGIKNYSEAYPILLKSPKESVKNIRDFKSLNELENEVARQHQERYSGYLTLVARTALDTKLKNRETQEELLATGNADLVWDDRSDEILGTGPSGQGDNFVGKYLQVLRKSLSDEHTPQEKLEPKDLEQIVDNRYIRQWLEMRARDMCKAVVLMKNYKYKSDKEEVKLNAEFVISVLDQVYQPCSHLFVEAKDITLPVPHFFTSTVIKQEGCSQIENDAIDAMWRRLAVTIQTLEKVLHKYPVQSTGQLLITLQKLLSQPRECLDQILGNPKDNCILAAILTILQRVSPNRAIIPDDIEMAGSLILGLNHMPREMLSTPREKPSVAPQPIPSEEPAHIWPCTKFVGGKKVPVPCESTEECPPDCECIEDETGKSCKRKTQFARPRKKPTIRPETPPATDEWEVSFDIAEDPLDPLDDDDDPEIDYADVDEEDFSSRFNGSGASDSQIKIGIQLTNISPQTDEALEQLVPLVLDTIEVVKEFPMSNATKTNRINFFTRPAT